MSVRNLFIFVFFAVYFFMQSSESAEWVLARQENFDQTQTLQDQVQFGDRDWLTTRIRNGGSIVVSGGRALISTPDFPDSALIRIFSSLPSEYKLRVRIGDVHYSVSNYETADYDHPDFKYSLSWVENGFYWLTLTDRPVESDSGEDWWHRYRKIVIDSDDHTGVTRPVYMVYMNPDLDRTSGDWLNGYANLLRCWSGGQWYTDGSWQVGFTYEDSVNYEVEIEKTEGQLIMRSFDSTGNLIQETDAVDLDLIYEMQEGSLAPEYAYFGEPHVDSYEGDAWVDDIRLWVVNSAPSLQIDESKNARVDEALTFSLESSDTTFLDSVSYSSLNLPSGATLDGESGLFSWTPTKDQTGEYSITFTAQDDHGATDSKNMTITVTMPTKVGGGCGKIQANSNLFVFSLFSIFALLMLGTKLRL